MEALQFNPYTGNHFIKEAQQGPSLFDQISEYAKANDLGYAIPGAVLGGVAGGIGGFASGRGLGNRIARGLGGAALGAGAGGGVGYMFGRGGQPNTPPWQDFAERGLEEEVARQQQLQEVTALNTPPPAEPAPPNPYVGASPFGGVASFDELAAGVGPDAAVAARPYSPDNQPNLISEFDGVDPVEYWNSLEAQFNPYTSQIPQGWVSPQEPYDMGAEGAAATNNDIANYLASRGEQFTMPTPISAPPISTPPAVTPPVQGLQHTSVPPRNRAL